MYLFYCLSCFCCLGHNFCSNYLKENAAKDELLIKELKEVKENLGKNVMELNWQLEEVLIIFHNNIAGCLI